jgi:hypothetical protein
MVSHGNSFFTSRKPWFSKKRARKRAGQKVVLDEAARVAAGREPLEERDLRSLVEQPLRLAVESGDVVEHPEEARVEQVPLLGEEGSERRGPVLEVAPVAAHREAHVALLPGDAEPAQEREEVGVGALVEDDEAGVHRHGAAALVHVEGVGVAPHAGVGLEEDHVVTARQDVRRHQSGDPRADDRDLHREPPALASR